MLMKKFLGATAREAMQKMKAELGPDALVISNRKTSGGVEILAMVEAEQELASHEPQASAEAPVQAPPARRTGTTRCSCQLFLREGDAEHAVCLCHPCKI